MGILECASSASVWRGYDYYKSKKVLSLEEIEENVYSATVAGSAEKPYSIRLLMEHPRKSKCNCPYADGKRIICKHIIATYFTVLPHEAERFYAEVIAYQEEEEKRQEELSDRVIEYIAKMKKADVCQLLINLLFDGPDWQYERFVEEHGLMDEWY